MNEKSEKPTGLADLLALCRRGEKFAMLTCYDATSARWLQDAGLRVLLVGDTAAEMILGFDRTIHAPLDFMIQITAAVKRGAPQCFVMADMPFMSYQADEAEAVRNAGRFMTEGRADAVKLEVGPGDLALVGKLSAAGIPVVAHLGSRPQQAARSGGYRAAGKTADEARALVRLAEGMVEAGAVMLLLEATAGEVAGAVTGQVDVPVIGCGAGPACDGQVIVLHDLLGLSRWQPPFAQPHVRLGEHMVAAVRQWIESVHQSTGADPYRMDRLERDKFA
ncbi:MAG: 3-methyl-2-oxobutanoate hydroxymethyltransferase, partial [Phycisphaeraceae bacterium]|nr:3-methyl-2-oxobutanoate hydroxymethyltransferase [Phycisphaeraceae bacterium]